MLALPEILLILAICILTVGSGVAVLWFLPDRPRAAPVQVVEPLALLFNQGVLHHATLRASNLLSMSPGLHDWADLREAMLARFPDFPETFEGTQRRLKADDLQTPHSVELRRRDDRVWVTLHEAENGPPAQQKTGTSAALQRAAQTAPNPVWEEDQHGKIIWHNDAYAALYKEVFGRAAKVDSRLFSLVEGALPNRVSARRAKGGGDDWFELKAVQLEGVTVYHTTSINAVIAAEDAQRNFVQTLAKTFAHLSTGLAVFDRQGQLVLFNPALLDLTDLNAPFLSARPTMMSFFDALRENRRMEEPKNYNSWRQEIAALIAAATDGRYSETWTLETGQTYSVNARQHPDGATAFLIEDISAEMTLTRNFRTELEQAQTMVNAIDDAMAIFLPSGVLTLSNAAFDALWDIDPEAAFADITLGDCTKIWAASCLDPAEREKLAHVLESSIIGTPLRVPMTLKNGTKLGFDVTHLPSGSMLIRSRSSAPAYRAQSVLLSETG